MGIKIKLAWFPPIEGPTPRWAREEKEERSALRDVWRVDNLDFMMVRAGDERADNAICAVGVDML